MNKTVFLALLCLASGLGASTRPTAVAGTFYPDDPKQLAHDVDQYLGAAQKVEPEKKLVALVCPHAGYAFSGLVAGWSYKQAQGRDFDLVVVVGPDHHVGFNGASVGTYDYFDTPLGALTVDTATAERLLKSSPRFNSNPFAHRAEHSVETQMPFIKRVLPNAKVLPIVMGYHDLKAVKLLAAQIDQLMKERKVLLVVSSDLSHYHPYDQAKNIDKETIEGIAGEPAALFFDRMAAENHELCGGGPVSVMKFLAEFRGSPKPMLLNARNSGDTTGDKSRVVGYAALALMEDKP